MHLIDFAAVLGEAAAPAAGSGTQPVNPVAQSLQPFGFLILMAGLFYVIMIRPQQKRAKEQALVLKNLKPGDRVVTSSGIVGIVVSVKEKTVALRSAETKLEVLKSAVTDLTAPAGSDAGES